MVYPAADVSGSSPLILDIVFHSKPAGSSKSMLNALHRYVPAICEQLQPWQD